MATVHEFVTVPVASLQKLNELAAALAIMDNEAAGLTLHNELLAMVGDNAHLLYRTEKAATNG